MTKSHDGVPNTQEVLFSYEYLKYFDAGKAWLAVVPDGNQQKANANGWKWLQRPNVKKILSELAAKKIEQADVGAERLIQELERIAFLDPIDFMEVDADGEPVLDLTSITPESRRLLDIEFGIGISKDGDRIRTYKVKSQNKMDAMDKLLKLHQLYKGDDASKPPMAIQVNVNFPLPGSNWRNNPTGTTDNPDTEDV